MTGGLFGTADAVLRRAAWTVSPDRPLAAAPRLLACVAVFGAAYGAAMGSYGAFYGGFSGADSWSLQVFYSAVKTPLLIVGSFAVSLPTFFVLSTLLGLRGDFGRAVRALVAGQAATAVTLASLAPGTLLFYASTRGYQEALLMNGALFAVATLAGQVVLRSHFRRFAGSRARRVLLAWGVAYVLVAVQLAWLLRPFIGAPGAEVRFFRPDAWDNAYVIVARLVWRTVVGE